MRHPFFNMTRLSLAKGEADFHVLEGREGVIVTIGPDTTIFDRPGRSVSRWSGIINLWNRSPHEIQNRNFIANELNFLSRILWGGGDVKFNMIQSKGKQREILLTAGDGNVVEKIDLTELSKQKVPGLLFLQPAYLCSSEMVEIKARFCDPSTMSWARAPYVYIARQRKKSTENAILCVSGRTMVWSEKLDPGERRIIALGNVIAVSENLTCSLQPTNQDDANDEFESKKIDADDTAYVKIMADGNELRASVKRQKVRDFGSSLRILINSMRAREGVLACVLINKSNCPGLVYTQLNKTSLYGGSGFIGVFIRILSSFFRWGSIATGN